MQRIELQFYNTNLDTIANGYFVFRYLRPDEEPNELPEDPKDCDQKLLF